MPDVSICLPVFNSASGIERSLRAVLAQDVPAREILVVDNCSTDDTVARAQRLLEGVPGARVIINDRNIGRIENWNRCLELAEGRYIRYAMANDIHLPGSAARLLREARSRPELAMISSQPRYVQDVPATPAPMVEDCPVENYDSAGALRRLSLKGNDTGGLNGLLLNGEITRRAGLRFRTDIPFWSDFEFSTRLAALGPVAYLDAESYIFDNSVKGRFTHAGLKNDKYYKEARECSLTLAKLLAEQGIPGWRGFEFFWRQYTGRSNNYGLAPLGLKDTFDLFEGAGPYRRQAFIYRALLPFKPAWIALRHHVVRVLIKAKLYRLPVTN